MITQEMREWFEKRTKRHINLVDKWYRTLSNELPTIPILPSRSMFHDSSKFEEPEYTPYLYISWKYKMKDEGKDFKVSKEIEALMNEATLHHIQTNPHHPEFWDSEFDDSKNFDKNDRDAVPEKIVDATTMAGKYLVEMVSDWLAMSEEKGTSVQDWYNKTVDKRWKFTEVQKVLIKTCIKIGENYE